MKKHLYEIKRLDIPAYLKWWFIKYRNAGTLSEVLENLTSPITLTNSLKRRFKIFEIGGKSEQETYTGKNKCISAIRNSATIIRFYMLKDIEKTITLSFGTNETLTTNTMYFLIDGVQKNIGTITGSKEITKTIIIPDDIYELIQNSNDFSLNIYKGGANFEAPTNAQIENGSTATAYEPYTGGQPAPNPSYECPIKNVGDNINIFDKSSTPLYKDQVDTQEIKTGVRVTTQNTGTYHMALYLLGTVTSLKGKEITVSANIVPSSSNLGGLGIILCDADGSNRTAIAQNNNITGAQSLTAKIDESYDDNKVIALRLYSNLNSAATGDYVDYTELKVEEGTEATPYSPYNCGNVEVKVENKNLFDVQKWLDNDFTIKNGILNNKTKDEISITSNSTDCYTLTYASNLVNKFGVSVLPQKTYTLSFDISGADVSKLNIFVWAYDKNLNSLGIIESYVHSNIIQFTTPENTRYITFRLGMTQANITIVFSNIQIEEGTTATDFIEHEEQTVAFPLEEGQRLHKDDAIREKIVQRRKTLVLDGTENWKMTIASRFYITVNDLKLNLNEGLCSHFKVQTLTSTNGITFSYGGTKNIYIYYDGALDVSEFKAWLAEQYANGTPVTLEYELDEPIETEFTEAQRTAKAQIDSLHSYKGTTYISSTNDPSPLFTIQYVKEET